MLAFDGFEFGVKTKSALEGEVKFIHLVLGFNKLLAAWELLKVPPRVHSYNRLVLEALVTLVEEIVKALGEVCENQLYYFSLHFGGKLLVKTKLFNDQIEVVLKGLLDGLTDVQIQVGW